MSDTIKVIRLVEIEGPRAWVERTMAKSIKGTFDGCGHGKTIRAAVMEGLPTGIIEQFELEVLKQDSNRGQK